MDRSVYVFMGMAFCFILCIAGWLLVDFWPDNALALRAKMGDQLAVKTLFRESLQKGDVEAATAWRSHLSPLSERDVLFMGTDERRIMHTLWRAQGRETPLLDVVD